MRPAPAEVTVTTGSTVAAGGDALGRLPDGRVVFCEGALPEERVRVVLGEQRRDFARARVVEVELSSPDRVDPPCPHARAGCGGCQWQHVDPGAQLRHKVGIVADSWRRLAHLELPPGPPPRQVGPGAYRTTLRLAVDASGRPAYRRRGSGETLAVDSCLVSHPLLEELVTGVRCRAGRMGAGRGTDEVVLRLGIAGGERLVVPSGGAVVVEAPVDAVVVGPKAVGHLHEDAGGRRWRVSGHSFFQSGPQAADLLAETVTAAVGDLTGTDTVVDLYAGVGLLGGVVAGGAGCRLVAVESSPPAAADAVANLADLDAQVCPVKVDSWDPTPGDVVIADPGRPGLGRPGVAAVLATGAGRVVLVSCDPASCARDAALLGGAGCVAVSAAIIDPFPHTFHVEVVTVFERP